jgi:hypothetical protein
MAARVERQLAPIPATNLRKIAQASGLTGKSPLSTTAVDNDVDGASGNPRRAASQSRGIGLGQKMVTSKIAYQS